MKIRTLGDLALMDAFVSFLQAGEGNPDIDYTLADQLAAADVFGIREVWKQLRLIRWTAQ